MPRLDPIGKVANPEDVDFGPIIVPIIGYTLEGVEVEKELRFRPQFSPADFLDMVRSADETGTIGQAAILDYLDSLLMPESKAEWEFILHDKDTNFSQTTIVELYQKIADHYAGGKFPTKQRSGSRSGSEPTKRTTRAAAPARGSSKKGSR
jgi:2-keto-3-deoxy-galactonokinase